MDEEKKVVIPPPPKELRNMPPPPPPRQPQGQAQTSTSANEQNAPQTRQKDVTENNAEDAQNAQKSDVVEQKIEQNGEKKAEKTKHKASGGIKTALYWTGFFVALGALAVVIYLLIADIS